MRIAVLALGCFWGPEIKFGKLEGIKKTEVGYCGGNSNIVTYEKVCSGNTNHAEVVKLEFDPKKISYEKILQYFFEIHNSTTLNAQGPDIGTQYRSEIFYVDEDQKKIEKIVVKIGAAKEMLTTVAKGRFLKAINIEISAIKPNKHLKKCNPALFV